MEITEKERMEFCANLMSAARKLSIDIAYFTNKGKHRYIWGDPVASTVIEGPIMDDQKDALFSACVTLQQYLHVNPPGKPS